MAGTGAATAPGEHPGHRREGLGGGHPDGLRRGTGRVACPSIARVSPSTSSAVSPLARSATGSAAGPTSPAMIRSLAQAVSSEARSRPSGSVSIRAAHSRILGRAVDEFSLVGAAFMPPSTVGKRAASRPANHG